MALMTKHQNETRIKLCYFLTVVTFPGFLDQTFSLNDNMPYSVMHQPKEKIEASFISLTGFIYSANIHVSIGLHVNVYSEASLIRNSLIRKPRDPDGFSRERKCLHNILRNNQLRDSHFKIK